MWWILVVAAVVLGYWLLNRPRKYWVERGVKQKTPGSVFGDNWAALLRKQSFPEMVEALYNIAPNARYFGVYEFFRPVLLLRDPDLIKQITVKDFDHFLDHRTFIPEDCDPIISKNLFALTGKKWREMRSTLSPAFTSSKMKYMFTLMSQGGEQFVNYFLKNQEDLITVEMKDASTRFTNDVIANIAFGIECDSLKHPDNEFYLMGKNTTDFSGWLKTIKFFGFFLMPSVFKYFKITFFSRDVGKFFTDVIKTNIQSREKHGIVRPDMVNLLLEARKNGLKHEENHTVQDTGFATVEESEVNKNFGTIKTKLTDEDIAAQAVIFFLAGFDTVSALMCFMSHELAVNPDVQEKLIHEVDDASETCKGKITYEVLLGMKYLDMVVCETLRKWPNAIFVDRVCTKAYTIEPKYPDEKPVHLKENDVVWFPLYGLHRDPQHWPEPTRFDPERFNDENKAKIKPCTYVPFGSGPRNCIGSRFALLETKTLFFYILSHFKIIPVEKTQIPLVLSKKQLNMTAEKGFWLGLKRRYNG